MRGAPGRADPAQHGSLLAVLCRPTFRRLLKCSILLYLMEKSVYHSFPNLGVGENLVTFFKRSFPNIGLNSCSPMHTQPQTPSSGFLLIL